jgi:hypothetical protein
MDTRLTNDHLAILQAPFPPEDMKFDYAGNAYIKEVPITRRIETIDPSWGFDITEVYHRDNRAVSIGRMTILGCTRGNIGMGTDKYPSEDSIKRGADPEAEVNDPEKSAGTDTLKRCARLFGIGRYILTLPKEVRDIKSYTRWYNNELRNNGKDILNQKTIQSSEPIEDVVITHWVKATPDGRKYHVLKTVNHGNISIWTRKLFREAAWIDENDWEVIGSVDEDLWIPVNIQPDGEHWEIVEVAQCTLDDIPL